MDNKKLYHFGAMCAFGLAAFTVANGIAFFTGPNLFFTSTRALVCVFAFGFFPAVHAKVRDTNPGWAIWTMSLAYVGVAAELIRYLGDLKVDTVWLFFGGLGVMLLTYNILALQHNLWPKALAWLGIVMSIFLLDVIVSQQVESLAFLNPLAALGAVVLYPIWLVWLGIRLRAE